MFYAVILHNYLIAYSAPIGEPRAKIFRRAVGGLTRQVLRESP